MRRIAPRRPSTFGADVSVSPGKIQFAVRVCMEPARGMILYYESWKKIIVCKTYGSSGIEDAAIDGH